TRFVSPWRPDQLHLIVYREFFDGQPSQLRGGMRYDSSVLVFSDVVSSDAGWDFRPPSAEEKSSVITVNSVVPFIPIIPLICPCSDTTTSGDDSGRSVVAAGETRSADRSVGNDCPKNSLI
ncbi:MAG: hypothetical protein KFH87_04175, partial [Bacteroidetes bacterium]|nr:hypothetical protein [Bacteroidota bacterium]